MDNAEENAAARAAPTEGSSQERTSSPAPTATRQEVPFTASRIGDATVEFHPGRAANAGDSLGFDAIPAAAPVSPAEPSEPGTGADIPKFVGQMLREFGDYVLLEEIARGGMGVVYKGRQISLNRIVAIKMILAGQLASPADVRRFRTEAEAAANLSHPNIVAIHEVGEHLGQHYFSMEYIEGQNLAGLIRGNPLPAEQAARYLKTIASAVHYVHERGTLHRDLKPSNVLIDQNDVPRITDFGLARQMHGDSNLTASGAALGTPSYMPPEQASGKRNELGPASDVYALGAILYELVSGQPPFKGETVLETLLQVLNKPPVPPRQWDPKIPPDLEAICLRCLEKTPARRYATAKLLAEDLERFLAGEPTDARPARDLPLPMPLPPRRHDVPASPLPVGVVIAPAAAWQPVGQPSNAMASNPMASNPMASKSVAPNPSASNPVAMFALVMAFATLLIAGVLGWVPCAGLIAFLPAFIAVGFGISGLQRAKEGAPHGRLALAAIAGGLLGMVLTVGLQLFGGVRIGEWAFGQVQRIAKNELDWSTLAATWNSPPPDATAEQLLPADVAGNPRIEFDDQAQLADLGIDLAGQHAAYTTSQGLVHVYVYRASKLEKEAIFQRVEQALTHDESSFNNDRPRGPNGTRVQYGDVHRWAVALDSGDGQGAFWWAGDRLYFVRAADDADAFLKVYLRTIDAVGKMAVEAGEK